MGSIVPELDRLIRVFHAHLVKGRCHSLLYLKVTLSAASCFIHAKTCARLIRYSPHTWTLALSAAANLSTRKNFIWIKPTFDTVFSMAPPMYWELWTAGKCTYKLEPVVSDGGRVIIYVLDPAEYENREDEGISIVLHAGEILFRLADGTVPDIDKL